VSAHVLVLVLLAGAALFASVRVLRHAPRHRAALVALQWLAAWRCTCSCSRPSASAAPPSWC
jgi:hypothetical protein